MKAVVYEKYGSPDVLQIKEVDKPVPGKDEVLVEVRAASINYIDWQLLTGDSVFLRLLNGLLKPKHSILGDDIAGRIEAVGERVNKFRPGDEVFGISNFGAFAEYCCVAEKYLGMKPSNITFEQAASVPEAGITALLGLRDHGKIHSGSKVLINGASGGVGTFAVQIAKYYGAEVTGVCSPGKMKMVSSIGADNVIDYTREDFTKSGFQYDLIFALAGYHSIFDYQRALSPQGVYVCAGGSMVQYFQAAILGPLLSVISRKNLRSMFGEPKPEDFAFLAEILEIGKITPVIDKYYPLSDVPEALQYYGEGNAGGKVIITL